MTKKELTMREKIELLIEDKSVSNYRIAKDTGVWETSVIQLRNGTSDLNNIRFEMAEKYAAFYDQLQAEREKVEN